MKISNLTVVFIIIVLPIFLVVSYYMSLQINTINMQTAYNTKILNATKSAIEAYEINTVEWNPEYSQHPDSQRRDVMASIETFITSFSNGLGVSGINKENVLTYIPAIAYTLYDGYYIYTPSEVLQTITDENEVTVILTERLVTEGIIDTTLDPLENEGKVLYKCKKSITPDGTYTPTGEEFTLNPDNAETEYKHILKPFSSYSKDYVISENVVSGLDDAGNDIEVQAGSTAIVNYTLDNYIKVYIKGLPVVREGYLVEINAGEPKAVEIDFNSNSINGIKYDGADVSGEYLTENIAAYIQNYDPTLDDGAHDPYSRGETNVLYGKSPDYKGVPYIYEIGNKTKVYIDEDGSTCFVIEDDRKVYLTENEKYFKKITVPYKDRAGAKSYIEVYQDLVTKLWYQKKPNTELTMASLTHIDDSQVSSYGINPYDFKKDYSGVNYCVESYIFTNWVLELGLEKTDGTQLNMTGFEEINSPDSPFIEEKRNVIQDTLNSNLNQAIRSYSEHMNDEFIMPKISETDWDQILTNVSIVTFAQNMPIGLKTYNNYAIATSTLNSEYVDPNELYLKADGDEYYHDPYCSEINGSNYIVYRNTDYVAKSYAMYYSGGAMVDNDGDGNADSMYYYRHTIDNKKAIKECYNCLIQRDLYKDKRETDTNKNSNNQRAYWTGLARERYVAKRIKLPPQAEPSYFVKVYPYYNDGTMAGSEFWTFSMNGGIPERRQGNFSTKIKKRTTPSYTIVGNNAESTIHAVEVNASNSYGSFTDSTKRKIVDENAEETDGSYTYKKFVLGNLPPTYSKASSRSNANVDIISYGDDGLAYTVTGQNIEYGQGGDYQFGNSIGNTSRTDSGFIDADDFGGNINIKLIYEKNYVPTDELDAFANIDNNGQLTIATNLKKARGYLRVVYTNPKCSTTYCTEVLHVTGSAGEEPKVFLTIPKNGTSDTSWYTDDWEVTVYNLANESIYMSGATVLPPIKVSTYTINTKEGLRGLSTATNTANANGDLARTQGRKFYLISSFSVGTDNFTPINAYTSNRFQGEFSGSHIFNTTTQWLADTTTYNTISDVKVSTSATVDTKYQSGLFGLISGNGIAQNFNISTINVTNNSTQTTGGVAGNIGASASVKNVTITGATIKGYGTTGGVVGYCSGLIDNCSFTGTVEGHVNENEYRSICGTGGLAGINKGNITGNTCNGTVKSGDNCYNIGGIVGYNQCAADKKVENNSFSGTEVSGGANCHNIGGIVGSNGAFDTDSTTGKVKGKNDSVLRNISKNSLSVGTVKGGANCENIGGVAGYSNNGQFFGNNCARPITGGSGSTNIGGVVGYSYGSRTIIFNCRNTGEISGDNNVGGIVGLSQNGWIDYCHNEGSISGKGSNTNSRNKLEDFLNADIDNAQQWYATGEDYCCGVGGIAGKIKSATISESSNKGYVTGEVNTGGITGICSYGTVTYCCNKQRIKTTKYNRVGGIIGAASNGVQVHYCYNIAKIQGRNQTISLTNGFLLVLFNGVGGIIGDIDDNLVRLSVDVSHGINTAINITNSNISYCYNSGELEVLDGSGKSTRPTKFQRYHMGGLIGGILNDWNALRPGSGAMKDSEGDKLMLNNSINPGNYFLEQSVSSLDLNAGVFTNISGASASLDTIAPLSIGRLIFERDQRYTATYNGEKNKTNLKNILRTLSPAKYKTDTAHTELGLEGYGILYWEAEGAPTDLNTVYSCKIKESTGKTFKAYGNPFVKSDASDDGTEKTSSSSGELSFYVRYASNNVTVHKPYYEDQTVYFTSGGTKNVTLQKKKYFATKATYTKSSSGAEWKRTGQLNNVNTTFHPNTADIASGDYSDTERDVLKLTKNNAWGKITLEFGNDTYNEGPLDNSKWKVTIFKRYVGAANGNSEMNVKIYNKSNTIIEDETLKFDKTRTDYDKTYTFNNNNIKKIEITFKATNRTDRRFWLASVYVENNS